MLAKVDRESEILVPEAFRAVRGSRTMLDPEELHHQVVDLHILERVHNVCIVRGRVPTLIRPRKEAADESIVGMLDGFDDGGEWTVRHKHSMHRGVVVVVAVVLPKSSTIR